MSAKIYKNGQWITVSGTPVYVKDAKIEDNTLVLTKKINGREETIRFQGGGESGSGVKVATATAIFEDESKASGTFASEELAKLVGSNTTVVAINVIDPTVESNLKVVSNSFIEQTESGITYRIYFSIVDNRLVDVQLDLSSGSFVVTIGGRTTILNHYEEGTDVFIFNQKDIAYRSPVYCKNISKETITVITDTSEMEVVGYYYLESGESGVYLHGDKDDYEDITSNIVKLDHEPTIEEVEDGKLYIDENEPLVMNRPIFGEDYKALSESSHVEVSDTGYTEDVVRYITIDGVEKKIAGGDIDIATEAETEDYLLNGEKFSIRGEIINGTLYGAIEIPEGGTATVTIKAESGYLIPASESDITIENAALDSYDVSTGNLIIKNPTDDVVILAECTESGRVYDIIKENTHCEIYGPDTIATGEVAEFVVLPESGYVLPEEEELVIINADLVSYDKATGTIKINNPFDEVTVGVTCSPETTGYAIAGYITNGNLTGDTHIEVGSTATCYIVPDSGYKYPAKENVRIENAVLGKYDAGTGEVIINSPTDNVTVIATCDPTPTVLYTITGRVKNGTFEGPATIETGSSADCTITPNAGYKLPDSIDVENAEHTWDSTKGIVVISNPTADVTVNAECQPE